MPVSASSGSWVSGTYREKKPGNAPSKCAAVRPLRNLRNACKVLCRHQIPFADMGRLVSGVGNKNLFLGKNSVTLPYWKYSHRASLAALALMCVPSMKTALGDRYPVSATSSSHDPAYRVPASSISPFILPLKCEKAQPMLDLFRQSKPPCSASEHGFYGYAEAPGGAFVV